MHFNVAKVCTVWSEELKNDYFNSSSGGCISPEEWKFGKNTTYREFLSLRWKAVNCLEKIIEMNPELPPDIVATLLANISDMRH